MTTLILKPKVYKSRTGAWVAELDYISWSDWSYFETWERAYEHALWLGFTAGVWNP